MVQVHHNNVTFARLNAGPRACVWLQMRFAAILIGLSWASFSSSSLLGAAQPNWLVTGPMLGPVTHEEAGIWAKSSGPSKFAVYISESADLSKNRRIPGPNLTKDTAFAGQLVVSGLEPNHRYYYAVYLDGKPAMLPPYPAFTTAPPPG